MATFVIGCSKSHNQAPTVHFLGYSTNTASDGARGAHFEFKNPSQFIIVFQGQIEPGGNHVITRLEPKSTKSVVLFVRETNAVTFSVTAMRVTSLEEISVPMPNTALEPTATAP